MNTYIIYAVAGILWLIGAALTYSRAENEGRNGSLWGLFALFAGPVAWIAYAMTGDREPMAGGPIIETVEHASASALHLGYAGKANLADPNLAAKATADYSDPYVERLIKRGDLRAAKEAIHAMTQTAREAHDTGMLAAYERYGQQIRHQELAKVDRNAPVPVAGPPSDFVNNTDLLHHNAKADVVGNDEHQALM